LEPSQYENLQEEEYHLGIAETEYKRYFEEIEKAGVMAAADFHKLQVTFAD